eukprot:scaffold88141_cov24-Prasinocladus_malaysianus.AAC.3
MSNCAPIAPALRDASCLLRCRQRTKLATPETISAHRFIYSRLWVSAIYDAAGKAGGNLRAATDPTNTVPLLSSLLLLAETYKYQQADCKDMLSLPILKLGRPEGAADLATSGFPTAARSDQHSDYLFYCAIISVQQNARVATHLRSSAATQLYFNNSQLLVAWTARRPKDIAMPYFDNRREVKQHGID